MHTNNSLHSIPRGVLTDKIISHIQYIQRTFFRLAQKSDAPGIKRGKSTVPSTMNCNGDFCVLFFETAFMALTFSSSCTC